MCSLRKQIQRFGAGLSGPILLVGASVRQLAQLIGPLGIDCVGLDLFSDWDTARSIPITQIKNYPDAIRKLSSIQPGAVIYSGGLEVYPDIVERLAEKCAILGCLPASLRSAKDPKLLSRILTPLEGNSIRFPDIEESLPENEPLDHWLKKSKWSTGGNGVEIARKRSLGHNEYFQKRVSGIPYSALFSTIHGRTFLLGVCQQAIGTAGSPNNSFKYQGSLGPVQVDDELHQRILNTGRHLASSLNLQGLFGFDFSLEHATMWIYDINPRITASAEILQRTTYRDRPGLIATSHLAAFLEKSDYPEISDGGKSSSEFGGKRIIYNQSKKPIQVSNSQHRVLADHSRPGTPESIWFTDIPRAGTIVDTNHPILTVQSNQHDFEYLQRSLEKGTEQVRQTFR